MAHAFPSESWAVAYKEAINANPNYATASEGWTHGAVAMVVKADDVGITEDMAVLLDLHGGICREAKYIPAQEARETAPFVVEGPYDNWKTLIVHNEDPVKALMQGKLSLTKGHWLTIVRYMESSKQLLASAQGVPTEFNR
jgi:putative sterol carrier protein